MKERFEKDCRKPLEDSTAFVQTEELEEEQQKQRQQEKQRNKR